MVQLLYQLDEAIWTKNMRPKMPKSMSGREILALALYGPTTLASRPRIIRSLTVSKAILWSFSSRQWATSAFFRGEEFYYVTFTSS